MSYLPSYVLVGGAFPSLLTLCPSPPHLPTSPTTCDKTWVARCRVRKHVLIIYQHVTFPISPDPAWIKLRIVCRRMEDARTHKSWNKVLVFPREKINKTPTWIRSTSDGNKATESTRKSGKVFDIKLFPGPAPKAGLCCRWVLLCRSGWWCGSGRGLG